MAIHRSRISVIAAAGAAGLALSACGGGNSEADTSGGTHKVGVILPLSGPGSLIGKDTESALKVFQEIDPGAEGLNITYIVCDDETTPTGASTCARKLVQQDNVDMVYGPIFAGMFEGAKPVLQNGPPSITSSPYSVPPANSSIFAASGAALDLDRTTLEFAKERGYKKVAVLATTDHTGQTALENIKEVNKDLGLDITVETMGPADADVSAQLTKLKQGDPDYIYVAAAGAAGGVALKGMDQQGMDIPTAMIWSNTTSSFFDASRQFLPTELVFAMSPSWLPDELDDAEKAKQVKDLQAGFEKETGSEISFVVQGAYDSFQLINATLKESGGDKEKGLKYLSNLENFDGLNWTISYTPEDHRGSNSSNYVMMRYDGDSDSWSTSK